MPHAIPQTHSVFYPHRKSVMYFWLNNVDFIRSLAKQIQSSFDKSLHCHEMLVKMQIPRVLSRHAVVIFCLPRKPDFRSCLMILKWEIAIWLLSLTVDISYASGTSKVVSLSVQPPKWSRPRNDPQPWNDPQIDPEMISISLHVDPEMIPI